MSALAPYAMHDAASRGRDVPLPPDPWRNEWQRDRDRIVHSRAFRRLAHKTQVFVSEQGDLFRSRLTHTIEVAAAGRDCARRLRLNEDLTEAIALVHDLGHPPFGHRGETVLDDLMKDHGGFEHNRQALRLVEELERRYADQPGLNLTYELREAIPKHGGDPTRVPQRFRPEDAPLIEAQIVDHVDSITYDCHDIDDGLRAGLITLESLAELPLWAGAMREATDACPGGADRRLIVDRALRGLFDSLVGDLCEHTARTIDQHRITDLAAVRAARVPLAGLSPSLAGAKADLEAWLFKKLYRHWQVNRVFLKAERILRELWTGYVQHPEILPDDHQERIEESGIQRVACDWLAGMTDRFALDEHQRLFRPGLSPGVRGL